MAFVLCNTSVNALVQVTHSISLRDNILVDLPCPAADTVFADNALFSIYENLTLVSRRLSPSPSKENTSVSERLKKHGEAQIRFTSTPMEMQSDPIQEMFEMYKAERVAREEERAAREEERAAREAERAAREAERVLREAEGVLRDALRDLVEGLQQRVESLEAKFERQVYGTAMRGFLDGIELEEGAPPRRRGTRCKQRKSALAFFASMTPRDLTRAFKTVREGGDRFAHTVDSSSVATAIANMNPADGREGFENLFVLYLGHSIQDEIEGRVASTTIFGAVGQLRLQRGSSFVRTVAPAQAPSQAI